MLKAIKSWFKRQEPKYQRVVIPEGDPYRTPGKPTQLSQKPSRDKWMAIAHRDLPNGGHEDVILGIVQGSEDQARDAIQELFINYHFQMGAFSKSGMVMGGYRLAPISDKEFEDYKQRMKERK